MDFKHLLKTTRTSLKYFAANRKLNGTILVAIGNEPIAAGSWGFADQAAGIKCSLETQYLIASVTKQFTAAAVLRALYEKDPDPQKTLEALHKPMGYFMPEKHEIWAQNIPPWVRIVTLHQLLTHTSGLPKLNVHGTPPLEASELVSLFKETDLAFEPGSDFAYASSNYLLLGELVQELTGERLGEYMDRAFFEPFEMKSTVYAARGTVPELKASGDDRFRDLSRGYCFSTTGSLSSLSEVDYTPMQIPGGGGSLVSTAHDLLKWNYMLHHGKILPGVLLEAMKFPHVRIPEPWQRLGQYYGYGICLTDSPQFGPIYSHHGGIAGFCSGLTYIPSLDLSLICLANREEGDTNNPHNLLAFEKVLLEELSMCRKP